MANKKTLTYAEYQEIGIRVKEVRKLLHDDLQLRICNGLGTSSKACRIIMKMCDTLDYQLKNELDNLVFRDHPQRDTKDLIRTNYGPVKNDRVRLLQKSFTQPHDKPPKPDK